MARAVSEPSARRLPLPPRLSYRLRRQPGPCPGEEEEKEKMMMEDPWRRRRLPETTEKKMTKKQRQHR